MAPIIVGMKPDVYNGCTERAMSLRRSLIGPEMHPNTNKTVVEMLRSVFAARAHETVILTDVSGPVN